MKPQRRPLVTRRQRKAVEELVVNGGSVTKAMIKAGYTEATASTPQKLTQSEGFRYLMEQMGVSDSALVDVLKDGLAASDKGEPDHGIRHKYLETGLRLKGLGKTEGGMSINFINHASEQRDIYDL